MLSWTDQALLGFLQPSPKHADLRRDGRHALHSFPVEESAWQPQPTT